MAVSLRSLAVVPVLVLACATSAAAATKGFVKIEGVVGTSKDNKHVAWFDMSHHELDLAGPSPTCELVVDTNLNHRMPGVVARLGTTIPVVEIELVSAGPQGGTYYTLEMQDVSLDALGLISYSGQQYDQLQMTPGSVRIEVREQKPDGTLSAPAVREVACGGR